MDWLHRHVLAWTTSAAVALTAAQLVAPGFIDLILDLMVVGLVWLAARLAQATAR